MNYFNINERRNRYIVYKLVDLSTGQPFYIGLTTNTQNRVYKHNLKFNQDFRFEVIQDVNDLLYYDAAQMERYWIIKMCADGYHLQNRFHRRSQQEAQKILSHLENTYAQNPPKWWNV